MKNEELSPRQILFLKGYLDPKSETFSNALQSALKAGFTQEYAENITNLMPNWLSEAIGSGPIVEKAEKNLEKALNDDEKDYKIWWDATKFALSRLKRDKYAERLEHTGADGSPLTVNLVKFDDNSNDSIQPTTV